MADKDDDKKKSEKLCDETIDGIKRQVLYGVGYGKPPKEMRFKKGKSGNASGRPRGTPPDLSFSDQPILAAAMRAADKKIKVREGDKVREVPAYEALTDAILNYALKGNARYAGLALDIIRTGEQAKAREIDRDNELWSGYKEFYSDQIAQALEEGLPEPAIYPHPDDIEIDRQKGPRFLGPRDEAEHKQVLHTVRYCEVLVMQDELDRRSATRLDGSEVKEPGTALCMFHVMNNTLPPRFKLSNGDVFRLVHRFGRLTKRELLKQVYESWRALGQSRPRGFVSGDLTEVMPWFSAYVEFAGKALRGEVDITWLSDRAIVELIQERAAERAPIIRAEMKAHLEEQRRDAA